MSDLIRRQDAIDAVVRESQVDGAYGYMDTKSLVDLLHDMPSALQEQKTGKWTIEDCHAATYKYCCSECNAHHRARYDFCPTCGARMVGDEE